MSPERNGWHMTVGRPARHIGWAFAGLAAFETRASVFLAEGFGRRERLVYIADDPKLSQWPKAFLDRGDLLVLSTSEVYGPERLVDPVAQRATYACQLAEALRDGYRGVRLYADGTSLIDGPGRLEAYLRWEDEAERFIAANPVTALCAFDVSRADAEAVGTALGVHRAIASPFP